VSLEDSLTVTEPVSLDSAAVGFGGGFEQGQAQSRRRLRIGAKASGQSVGDGMRVVLGP
jgi:hypothetical protein